MITTVNYNRRAGQSRWSNPGGENSELLYNVIAPMMADAELPSRVMQPQASRDRTLPSDLALEGATFK